MSKIDRQADTVRVDGRGIVRMDEVPLFRLVADDGMLWIEVKDGVGPRCAVRGDECIWVPFGEFIAKLVNIADNRIDKAHDV